MRPHRVAVHKVLLAVAVQHVDCVALAVVIKLGAEVNPIEAVRDKAAGDNDDGSLSKDGLKAACALLELPYPALAPARSPTLPSMPRVRGTNVEADGSTGGSKFMAAPAPAPAPTELSCIGGLKTIALPPC